LLLDIIGNLGPNRGRYWMYVQFIFLLTSPYLKSSDHDSENFYFLLMIGHKDTKMLMRYTHLRAEDLVGRLGRMTN